MRGRIRRNPEQRHYDERDGGRLLVRTLEILTQPESRDVVVRRQAIVNASKRWQRREHACDRESSCAITPGSQVPAMIHPR
jgi:hypothetical protein